MANEIRINIDYFSGLNLYAVIFNAAGQVWYIAGEVFEVWGTGSRTAADYDIALTGTNGASFYKGNFDANIPAGRYFIQIREQVIAAPLNIDAIVGSGEIVWDGSNEVFGFETDGGLVAAAITDVLVQCGSAITAAALATASALSTTDSKVDTVLADTNELQVLATTGGAGSLKFIKDMQEADIVLDKTTTPWQVVLKIKGTSTVLARKNLKDKDGNNITSVNALIGQYLEP